MGVVSHLIDPRLPTDCALQKPYNGNMSFANITLGILILIPLFALVCCQGPIEICNRLELSRDIMWCKGWGNNMETPKPGEKYYKACRSNEWKMCRYGCLFFGQGKGTSIEDCHRETGWGCGVFDFKKEKLDCDGKDQAKCQRIDEKMKTLNC